MAKKAQKGKTAKKAVKPAKKATKPTKKAAKPTKKAIKKASKPAKKVVKKAAKPTKKAAAKKPVKKVIAKKIAKPAKKVVAKKAIKPVKKAVAQPVKKVVPKTPVKPVKKEVVTKAKEIKAKPAATPVQKPVIAEKTKPAKKDRYVDLDDDGSRDRDYDMPMVVEYKTPSIRRPMGPAPKPHVNTDTRTRYSDAELKEFKVLILKKLEEAQADYDLLKNTLSHKDDHGTDDTSPTFKLLEDGSDVLSKEETAHLASRQEKFIQNLQNALIRIENKTYGICRATGKLISKERLRSVPHATLAIGAKLEQSTN